MPLNKYFLFLITDCRLDLFGSGSQQSSVSDRTGDGPVNHVVDFVGLQTEDFGQPASDFVLQDHGLDGILPS